MSKVISINVCKYGDLSGLRFFKLRPKPKTEKTKRYRRRGLK